MFIGEVSKMTSKYRINNRIRFTLFVVLTILLLTFCINFALGLNTAHSATIDDYIEVKVSSGDTLWTIAETYMDNNTDIRKSVYLLGQLNDISAAELQAGMILKVPVCH